MIDNNLLFNNKEIKVKLNGSLVGRMAETTSGRILFEYSDEWINNGFSISPFSLPLEKKIYEANWMPFEGLFGVFADSLPDGWGRLLMDRFLTSRMGLRPQDVSAFMRLMMLSELGMGGLEYEPSVGLINSTGLGVDDFDRLHEECRLLYDSEELIDDKEGGCLDRIYEMGGSSGGARPKVNARIDGDDWIVKFPSSTDVRDIGKQEYEYNLCTAECGIDVAEVRLIESQHCAGYFATKRFDRTAKAKIHMVSVSGLLENSHRVPSLDYSQLIKLIAILTRDTEQVWEMYRRMCFNVFAHNRDDHSKNFSFLCTDGAWRLSPAYDLTYSNSIGGEHATTIAGEGKNPGIKDILKVATDNGLDEEKAMETAKNIKRITNELSVLKKEQSIRTF